MTGEEELLEPLRRPRPDLSALDAEEIMRRAGLRQRRRAAAAGAVLASTAGIMAIALTVGLAAHPGALTGARTPGPDPERDCSSLPISDVRARLGPPLPDTVLLQPADFAEQWGDFAHHVGPASPAPSRSDATGSLATSTTRPGWSLTQIVTETDSVRRADAQFAELSARLTCRETGGTTAPGRRPPSSSVVVNETVRSGARILLTRRTEHGSFEDGPSQTWSVLVSYRKRVSVVDMRSLVQLSPTSRYLDAAWVAQLAALVTDRLQGLETTRLAPLRTVGAPSPGSSPGIVGTPRLDVSGTLVMVGGPPTGKQMTPRIPVSGTVVFLRQSDGARVSVAVSGGEFQTTLPTGRYTVGGRSPKFNEGRTDCRTTGTVVVTAHTAPVEVVCPTK